MTRHRIRFAAVLAGTVGLGAFWVWAMAVQPSIGGKPFGVDAMAYWMASAANPYAGAAVGLSGAYLYSPAFLQALTPVRLMPWEIFMGAWLMLELGALAWLLTPLGALAALLAFPPVTSEVLIGNIHAFLAVALVVSIARPWTWVLPLLTKVSPGVGLGWYVGRRDWRGLGMALGVTTAVVFVSFAFAPALWFEWFERLRGAEGRGGLAWTLFLVARLAVAALLSVYAGWRGRPALLPIAFYLALPIPWVEGLTVLAAVPRLLRWRAV